MANEKDSSPHKLAPTISSVRIVVYSWNARTEREEGVRHFSARYSLSIRTRLLSILGFIFFDQSVLVKFNRMLSDEKRYMIGS